MSVGNTENVAIAIQHCTASEVEDIAWEFGMERADLMKWVENKIRKPRVPSKDGKLV